jgi:hypothetical protein
MVQPKAEAPADIDEQKRDSDRAAELEVQVLGHP